MKTEVDDNPLERGRQPTVDERLDGLDCLTPVPLSTSAAEAVRESREADEAALNKVMSEPRRQRLQKLVEKFGTLDGLMTLEELRKMREEP